MVLNNDVYRSRGIVTVLKIIRIDELNVRLECEREEMLVEFWSGNNLENILKTEDMEES
jgi:hypothetical protein